MNYLTAEQVLFIHARIIAETGGAHGVRDLGLLQSAVARPRVTFDNSDLYPDVFSKSGALLDSLINNHPFVDGNKRTGIASAVLFLNINGLRCTASNQEMEDFVMRVATHHSETDELSLWFKAHSRQE